MVKIPLFEACRSGNEVMVKYLMEHGADVNKINKKGITRSLKNIIVEMKLG